MNSIGISEPVFEALFRQAVIDDYIDEIESIPPNEELAKIYSFTPEFELRMQNLFKRIRKKAAIAGIAKHAKRAAAVLLIAATVFFGLLLTQPEVRAAVGNVVVKWFEQFTSITYHSEGAEEHTETREMRPTFLPDGYFESFVINLDNAMLVMFSNDAGDEIRFTYTVGNDISTAISVSNAHNTIEEYVINGTPALIVTAHDSDEQNGVIFAYDDNVVDIWGRLPIDLLIEIAESVGK